MLCWKGGIRHYPNHPIYSEKITRIVLERLEYDKDFIQEVCYLVKNHDYPIREREVKENPSLLKKRLEVQRCDALAHNPEKLEKRKKYLEKTKKYFEMWYNLIYG